MKPILLSILIGAAILPLMAQTTSTNSPTREVRPNPPPPPVLSPEIETNRIVTFRLRATNAHNVAVNGQWPDGRTSMTEDTNGVWSVTVGPVEPGVWEYSFQVDGLSMIDPGNPMIKPMRLPTTSILQIRGDPPLLWDFQNVPHGTVHLHTYYSAALNCIRNLVVYTPPGYEQNTKKKYPVLYLQHGYGDNQEAWVVHGKANVILDNLIAQGRAQPMIVVMMDGHAIAPTGNSGTLYFQENEKSFERDFFQNAMPLAEKNYHVKSGSANRAIVGLSMGGGQSLTIGLNHSDTFAWVGGFSSATPSETEISAALQNPSALNHNLKLLWIGDGKSDFLLKRNEDFIALLKEKNIRYEWHLTEGDHSWPVWRNYLIAFVPELFR
ncbi:MAG TPA: alpha/beta hydrolase-fold protein [Verrucomicrobiae bacterium]|nr:alpha/beta hydrolase-fold protein [Verrucomicrobiae bacterium]